MKTKLLTERERQAEVRKINALSPDEVINNGWEHHYALMYGDHADELRDFCRNLNIEYHLVK